MSIKVTQLFPASNSHAIEEGKPSVHTLQVPLAHSDLDKLLLAIQAEGLEDDQQSIWLAYPNLRVATEKLLAIYSLNWPLARDSERSMVIEAAIEGVREVKRSIQRNERSRSHVVAGYLRGLAMAAEDSAHLQAWGVHRNRPVEQWTLEQESFGDWVSRNDFQEVRFYEVSDVSRNEVEGTRMKVLCSIASTRDVGVVARYS